jgi:hypothetical protein
MLGIFGTISNPTKYGTNTDNGNGLFLLLNNLFKLVGVIAGVFFVVQIILAGFGYLSASGDPKKTEAAFATIWQSLIGLAIVSVSFVLASFIGKILGIDNILTPTIYGPGQ